MNEKRENSTEKRVRTSSIGLAGHLPKMNGGDSRIWNELPHLADSHQNSVARRADLANWFYVPSWKRSLLPKSEISSTKNHWLLFVHNNDIGNKFAEQLKGLGQRVSIVRPADVFSHKNLDGGIFTIQPFEAADYLELFKHLKHHPDKIVHMWHIDENAQRNKGSDSFFSLLFFAQALAKAELGLPVEVGVVTSHMYDVLGGESINTGKGAMLGPIRVMSKEIPQTTCKSIDFPIEHPDGLILSQLLAEMADTTASEVAWRGQHRWVQTFEAVRLLAPTQNKSLFKEHNIYLITDGFGTIGNALAQYLAEMYQAKLVLLGRSEFPKRADWGAWLNENGNDNSTSKKILQVQALEKSGGQILVQQGDLTDIGEIETVFEATVTRFGPINTIFHTAEVVEESKIRTKETASAEQVLGVKVTGTNILYDLLKKHHGELMVLFSSTSSYLAPSGQVDYVGANAYMDSFAQHEANLARLDGPEIFSINWPHWFEGDVTQQIDHSIWKEQLVDRGISAAEGISALTRIMHHGLHRAIVSPVDFLSESNPPIQQKSEPVSIKERKPQIKAHLLEEFNPKAQSVDKNGLPQLKTNSKHQTPKIVKDDDSMPTLKNLLVRQFVKEKSKGRWLSLVKLQEGNALKAPLFLMHGADGDVLIYQHLVHSLNKDQPVYALQAAGNNLDTTPHTTIEQMAGHYTQEILRAQPKGPYMLGGYAIGGVIALETAQQLRSLGYEVSLVAMLESYNMGCIKKEKQLENLRLKLQTFNFNIRNLLKLNRAKKQTFLTEKLTGFKQQTLMAVGKTFTSGSQPDLKRINKAAALEYAPNSYGGYMLQVEPIMPYKKYDKPGGSFETMSKANCHTTKLDVYPAGMLSEAFVGKLAEILSKHIEKANR